MLSLLSTTYNCAYNTGINCYPLQIPYFTLILEPYCKCSDLTISLHAKMIMAMVQDVLTDEDFEIFRLQREELDAIVTALDQVSTSNDSDVGIFDYRFSPEEVMFSLKHLLSCRANREMVAHMNVVPSFAAIVQCSDSALRVLACQVLLILLMESTFEEKFLKCDLPLLEVLEELSRSTVPEIGNLVLCILDKLGHSDAEGEFKWNLYDTVTLRTRVLYREV